jgi:hypothetical protein
MDVDDDTVDTVDTADVLMNVLGSDDKAAASHAPAAVLRSLHIPLPAGPPRKERNRSLAKKETGVSQRKKPESRVIPKFGALLGRMARQGMQGHAGEDVR